MTRLLGLLLLWVASSCSAIAAPGDVRCAFRDGVDPCSLVGPGLVCVDEICQPGQQPDAGRDSVATDTSRVDVICAPEENNCTDLIDNDCDGNIDESNTFVEICDGIDDNCNDVIDDNATCPPGNVCLDEACVRADDCTRPGVLCEEDERCEPTLRVCVRRRCPDLPCAAPFYCDTTTGTCLEPKATGATCNSGNECMSAVCAARTALGRMSSGSVCTRACCNESDCGSESICFASGTGAKLCIPPAQVGLGSRVGTGLGDARCTLSTDCRSNICLVLSGDDFCLDNCATNSDCPAPAEVCAVLDSDGGGPAPIITGCVQPGGRLPGGVSCRSRFECQSLLCHEGTCASPCARASDCAGADSYCGVFSEAGFAGRPHVCLSPDGTPGTTTLGAACAADTDCAEGLCTGSVCRAPCCRDLHCGSGQTCAPVGSGSAWRMACLPDADLP